MGGQRSVNRRRFLGLCAAGAAGIEGVLAARNRIDRPLQVFRTAARKTRIFGHAGPATAKATQVFSKYIVTDMYAKAVPGTKAEDAVRWADQELGKIYG